MMRWIFDPLHRFPQRHRAWMYLWLAVFFARLAAWYGIDERWGRA